ncbi:serine--tRNA ligase [Spiroplasma endosymbiont of Labia minor]|uniref:serine--tRNA ligase n=1 Tax=Spiroplasma endosymbiont of Labia minor TaxID=3066305 RepID=UPI0030D00812
MININHLEKNFKEVTKRINNRQTDYSQQLKEIVDLNTEKKIILSKVEKLKAEKNIIAKKIGSLMKEKSLSEVTKLKNESTEMNIDIDKLDIKIKNITQKIYDLLSYIPNIPHKDIPIGQSENENLEKRRWQGENFKSSNIPHWEIATKLNLVDFERGVKISGSRFLMYTNRGSKLIRSIANILLDFHTSNGYSEYHVPFIVNKEIMFGTGQIPKFIDDAYTTGNQYLIPTAEVPLTNMYRNEILDYSKLPIKMTAYTQCFRQEAGSAGKDTKGMIRLHQFNKIELVKIVEPKLAFDELEKMTTDVENVLKLFDLPYRVIELCSGDLGFSATKTYDLEVWMPNQSKFREISSCSNCSDFQARRMQTRFKQSNEIELVHTLNGSGVAIDRLIAAILENFWDGEKLILPKVLKPYFNNADYIN